MNYQKELDKTIENITKENKVPTLLLHSCCAPCSTYVLEYLSDYFEITVFYYNPNIFPESEYTKRICEQQELISQLKTRHPIHFIAGEYDREEFYRLAKGHEEDNEGGARCMSCYKLRLKESAILAKAGNFDYFTTTLTISPMKKSVVLNQLGESLGDTYEVAYLSSDFKKKNGFKRSVELSDKYGLYRQDYCGCEFSMKERDARNN